MSPPSVQETNIDTSSPSSRFDVDKFNRDGYLIIPDFLPPETVSILRQRVIHLLDEFSVEGHPMTKFSTGETEEHVGDDYFLTSGDKIRYFLEIEAVDSTGKLTKPKERAVNKIGHGLHDHDPAFRKISLSEDIKKITRDIGFCDPRMLQSMIICKQPEIGGSVPSHQDSVFLYTDPPSAVGFWFALEDCTKTNGCLSFVPGSHKTSPITKRFVRQERGTGFISLGGELKEPDEEQFKVEECRAGTLVIIHGNVLHKSEANRSLDSRYIYTFHVIEGEAEYDAQNWLQPTERGFTKIFS